MGKMIGTYEILREVGRGNNSIVYLARQAGLERKVALKVLARPDAKASQKFAEERKLSAQLRGPGVRAVYDAGTTPDGHPYVVMEYAETTLREVLRDR